jgi:hypothetical protein
MIDKDLCLVHQTSKRSRVNNAVTVALELRAVVWRILRVTAATGVTGVRGIRG